MPEADVDRVMSLPRFEAMFERLEADGYRVLAPTVDGGAVVWGEAHGPGDLPRGIVDRQSPGRYRLEAAGDAFFGYAVGPSSPKAALHAPEQVLFEAERPPGGPLRILDQAPPVPRTALVGLRPCELAAIAKQDRVLRDGPYPDVHYARRRADLLTVVVECGAPSGACFCASMGAGPGVDDGFDLALTELLEGEHRFYVRTGSDAGRALAAGLELPPAADADYEAAQRVVEVAKARMGRQLDTEHLRSRMYAARESPRYQAIEERCLGCGSCTMVCPTCFCTAISATTDLSGTRSAHVRRWDSCFTMDFSYIHGGPVRPSLGARYRQWITHKLAAWHDQFGESGCVGCGRCITWCPMGIDITAEAAALGRPSAREG